MFRRTLLIISAFLLFIQPYLAQDELGPELYDLPEKELIDTLWDLTISHYEQSFPLSRHLISVSEANDSYVGTVNGYQLVGEAHYMIGNLDSAQYYYSYSLELAQTQKDVFEIGNCNVALASIETERGNVELAHAHYLAAIELQEADNRTDDLCDSYLRMGNLLINSDELDESMAAYLTGIGYCEECGRRVFMGYGYDAIGTIHKKQGNYEKAMEMHDSALEIYMEEADTMGMAGYHNNVGIIFKNQGKYQLAYDHYSTGLELMKTQNYFRAEMSFLTNMGISANRLARPDLALEHLRDALEIAAPIGISITVADVTNEMAIAFIQLNQLDSARHYVDWAISTSTGGHHIEKLYDAYKTQSDLLVLEGDAEGALDSFKLYAQYKDSIFSVEKAAEIDRLQTEYDTERKENEIAQLESDKALDAARKRALIAIIIGLSVAAILIIVSIVLKRRKDRQLHEAEIEIQEVEKEKLTQELEFKKKELTSKVLHIAQKNEMLIELKNDLDRIKKADNKVLEIDAVNRKLKFEEQIDNNWDQFTKSFTETNQAFFKTLTSKHPDITKSELRLAALIQMNLSSKEVATVLNISDEGVKKSRYRLRKKLQLETDEGLESHLLSL